MSCASSPHVGIVLYAPGALTTRTRIAAAGTVRLRTGNVGVEFGEVREHGD